MDKHGWTYKKLGNICEVINGLWTGKKEPFVNVAVIRNTNFSKDCKLNLDNVAYIDVEKKQYETRKLRVGDIIIEKSGGSDKQPVGRPVLFSIPDGEYSFSNFTSALRIKDKNINPVFLQLCLYQYYRNGETKRMQSKTTGLRNLDMKAYLRLAIPYCELAEQEHIVAELDLLSSVIEKKKAQLSEYDQLAQSIYYDMFGDPIDNPKGWEVKKLGDVFSIGSSKRVYESQWRSSGIPFYRAREIVKLSRDGQIDNELFIDEELYNEYAQKYGIPKKGDIMVTGVGTLGICYIVKETDKFYFKDGNTLWFKTSDIIDPIYVVYSFKTPLLRQQIDNSNGATVGTFTIEKAKKTKILYPPLSLQQQFAEKIEAIEKQKALVQASIAETETLFNSRMDYYFN